MKNPNTTVGLSKETLQLVDKVKELQYHRLGVKLSRNQTLTLVLKDYLNRQGILTSPLAETDEAIKEARAVKEAIKEATGFDILATGSCGVTHDDQSS